MAPGQKREMHMTNGTDARRAPERKRDGAPSTFISGSSHATGGSPSVQAIRGKQLVSRIFVCQAEDGIRDATVTGVQTCALPISAVARQVHQAVVRPGPDEPLHERRL